MFGKLQSLLAVWSTGAKVAASVVATAAVVAIGGGAAYMILNEEVPVIEPEIIAEASGDASADAIEEPVNDSIQEIVEVPEYASISITGESLVQDLTMYLLDENRKKVVGHEFSVALLSLDQLNKLDEYIVAVEEIDEQIAALGEDEAEEEKETETAEKAEKAESTVNATESTASATSDRGIPTRQDKEKTSTSTTKEETEKTPAAEELLQKVNKEAADVQVSSITGKELTEREKLLLKKAEAMEAYREALIDLKADTYVDDNADGVIVIPQIDGGSYYATLVPNDTYIQDGFNDKVEVKEELEYKALENIEMKAVEEEEAEDVQEEEEIVEEEKLTDTVAWVESSKKGSGSSYVAATPKVPSVSVSTTMKDRASGYSTGNEGEYVPTFDIVGKESDVAAGIVNGTTYQAAVYKYDEENQKYTDEVETAEIKFVYSDPITVDSTEEQKGKVMSYTVSGKYVTATVGKGVNPETLKKPVPDLSGKTLAEATSELTALGLTVKEVKESSNDIAEGKCISQSPAAGTSVDPGTEVTVTISSGPNINLKLSDGATVYSSSNSSLNTANLVLENTGLTNLKVTTENSAILTATISDNKVVVTAKEGITSDKKIKVEVSGQITVLNEKRTYVVAVFVNVKASTTALKDKDGKELYKDQNGTVATVADYSSNTTYYIKNETYTYYGWQMIDGVQYYFDQNGNKVTGPQVIKGTKYTFAANGALQAGGYGIDVSKWQGTIDWSSAKNAISFAIIRCGFRSSSTHKIAEDSYVNYNMQQAKANGVRFGLYFYSVALTEAEAVEEASLAVAVARRNGGVSLPIYIDMEDAKQKGLSTAQRDAIVLAFCRTISNAGYNPGIYANKNWLTNYLTPSSYGGIAIWVAQYNTSCTYNGRYSMWQYTSKGTCPGITGDVDMNISYF